MIHVGVLTPLTGGFYYGDVIASVVRAVSAAGGRVTLVQTIDAGRSRAALPPTPDVPPIGWRSFDGIVAIGQAATTASLEAAIGAGTPVVVIGNDVPLPAARVVADNREVVQTAVAHLVEHGHRRIAFVGDLTQSDTRARFEGYRAGLVAHGLAFDASLHVPTVDHIETGGRRAAPSIAADPAITAVVASTDRVALGLITGLAASGVRVPQDVAVVGYDDVEEGWWHDPPLTTVHQPIRVLGTRAAELLLAELAGDVQHGLHVMGSAFLPRGTCGCSTGASGRRERGASDAEALVAAVGDHLRNDPAPDEPAALERLDAFLLEALAGLQTQSASRETVESFVEGVFRGFAALAGRGDATAVLSERAAARTFLALRQLERAIAHDQTERLAASIVEQYDVGIEVLSEADGDPAALGWLSKTSTRLACLGLWEDGPDSGVLRIAGVFDPLAQLDTELPGIVRVEDFPPRVLVERADAGVGEVLFVVPVRGLSGDHGLLCVLGAADVDGGSASATYAHWAMTHNHWAAMLGVALKQQSLLKHLGRSEERYSLATRAANDGLWEWDTCTGDGYASPRCREILGISRDVHVDAQAWTATADPDDAQKVADAVQVALGQPGTPVEVEYRTVGVCAPLRWVLVRCLAVPDEGGAHRIVGSVSDIQARKDLEGQLRQEALYDNVTGLPNRRLLVDRLDAVIQRRGHDPRCAFALLFLDLDGFKLVNDTLGHLAGDELLRVVADRMRSELRPDDTAARFGGDEFAVLLVDPHPDEVLAVAGRLQARIAEPIVVAGLEIAISASVGIATSETDYATGDDVLRDADAAMYHAKSSERGSASMFDPGMHVRASDLLRTRAELRTAEAQQQFEVYFQPIMPLDGAGVSSFEALVRWRHPERGVLLPAAFLPVMEEDGSIVRLGAWVLDQACRQIAVWFQARDIRVAVAVNLSHREFWSPSLLSVVEATLARHGVPPEQLVLEITESVIIERPDDARELLESLHRIGVRLHIDDFGTGQSSLAALRTLPVEAIKLDRAFIRDLSTTAKTRELVQVIFEMGRVLGLEVIAECVETQEQAVLLQAMGCASAQGWLYAHALREDEATRMLSASVAPDGTLRMLDDALPTSTRSQPT